MDELMERAKKGDVDAQNGIGDCYYYGEGVEQNKMKAVQWYRQAAENCSSTAQRNLGYMYSTGEGVVKNYGDAYFWLLIAAANGDEDAFETRDRMEKKLPPRQRGKIQAAAKKWLEEHQ